MAPSPKHQPSKSSAADRHWQERLLPFMIRMLGGLTIFFLVASFAQLIYLHNRIENGPVLPRNLLVPAKTAGGINEIDDAIVLLEAHVVDLRYHQTNVFLMARVWTNYLGFVTGMTLAMVGAAFILGKLKTEASELEGHTEHAGLTLKTASPGIALAVLGAVLMITTIIVEHPIETKDVPVYLGPGVKPRPNLPTPPSAPPAADPKPALPLHKEELTK